MCDIRFFKSARHCYDVAANLIKYYEQDEMYLNDVAYNLQQCVEKTLKAFLECKGVTIPQTHNLHKLIAMSENNGSSVIITDWIVQNQYEIETWESDTRYNICHQPKGLMTCASFSELPYNFDISLEFERIQEGLQKVKQFLDVNHMSYTLNPELTAEMKEKLRTKLPKSLDIRDDFEWNCYYTIFKKQLS